MLTSLSNGVLGIRSKGTVHHSSAARTEGSSASNAVVNLTSISKVYQIRDLGSTNGCDSNRAKELVHQPHLAVLRSSNLKHLDSRCVMLHPAHRHGRDHRLEIGGRYCGTDGFVATRRITICTHCQVEFLLLSD